MRLFPTMLLAFATSLAGVAGAAAEAGKTDDFATRLFASNASAQKQSACFMRTYDAAHLAGHPQQKVRQMMLLVSRDNGEPGEDWSGMGYQFSVGFRMRGESTRLESGGSCTQGSVAETGEGVARLDCGVDCDGGGLSLKINDDNKSLRVEIERIRVYKPGDFGREDEDGPVGGRGLGGGADDRVFRLDRVSLKECLPIMSDKAQIASVKRMK